MSNGIQITFVSGDQTGSSVNVHGLQTIVFGSSGAADVQVNDPNIEPLHFEVRGELNRFRVVDLGTAGGTFVNRQRVTSSLLVGGEEIAAGKTQWRVHRDVALDDTVPPEPRENPGGDRESRAPHDSEMGDLAEVLSRAGYELHEELGRGAFGAVYRATRTRDRQVVAIKVLENLSHVSSKARKTFQREVHAIEKIRSPHIVQLIDAGDVLQDFAWYAMEFVPDANLKQWVAAREFLPPASACQLMRQLLVGLEAAHELPPPDGPIVHRDVKPANIMVARKGDKVHLKLADFGTAKNFEEAGHSALTRTGDVRGTLLFMSREQLMDSRYIGPQGDIFAAGAVFYFLLTKSAMYDLKPNWEPSDLVNAILTGSIVPLDQRRPDVPEALNILFQRATGIDPTRQLHSARQFRLELEKWLAAN